MSRVTNGERPEKELQTNWSFLLLRTVESSKLWWGLSLVIFVMQRDKGGHDSVRTKS